MFSESLSALTQSVKRLIHNKRNRLQQRNKATMLHLATWAITITRGSSLTVYATVATKYVTKQGAAAK